MLQCIAVRFSALQFAILLQSAAILCHLDAQFHI